MCGRGVEAGRYEWSNVCRGGDTEPTTAFPAFPNPACRAPFDSVTTLTHEEWDGGGGS